MISLGSPTTYAQDLNHTPRSDQRVPHNISPACLLSIFGIFGDWAGVEKLRREIGLDFSTLFVRQIMRA